MCQQELLYIVRKIFDYKKFKKKELQKLVHFFNVFERLLFATPLKIFITKNYNK